MLVHLQLVLYCYSKSVMVVTGSLLNIYQNGSTVQNVTTLPQSKSFIGLIQALVLGAIIYLAILWLFKLITQVYSGLLSNVIYHEDKYNG